MREMVTDFLEKRIAFMSHETASEYTETIIALLMPELNGAASDYASHDSHRNTMSFEEYLEFTGRL